VTFIFLIRTYKNHNIMHYFQMV